MGIFYYFWDFFKYLWFIYFWGLDGFIKVFNIWYRIIEIVVNFKLTFDLEIILGIFYLFEGLLVG